MKALQTGCKWAWNPGANIKTKRPKGEKGAAPILEGSQWRHSKTTPEYAQNKHSEKYRRGKEATTNHRQ